MPKKIVPTEKQRKAAKAIVENAILDKPKAAGVVLKNVGYGTGLQDQPSRVLDSPGFQEALNETEMVRALRKQGINPKKIASKIDVLLEAKKKNMEGDLETDFTAVDKGLKHATTIYGLVEEKPATGNKNTYNFIFSPEVQTKVRDINEDIKKLLSQQQDDQKD